MFSNHETSNVKNFFLDLVIKIFSNMLLVKTTLLKMLVN